MDLREQNPVKLFGKHLFHDLAGDLRVTDLVMRNAFWIGVYPGLGEKEVVGMIQAIRVYIAKWDGEH